MKREKMIEILNRQTKTYDFIVIGGGAAGIGIALEASARGYSVALFEKADFTKSTSSKSTKIAHGGVRYLAQGNVALVREACVERGLLRQNAPHLVKNLWFIIPTAGLWEEIMYTLGLTFYDMLAGRLGLGKSKPISKKKTLKRIPTLNPNKLTAGVVYHDGQFDDSRLAINSLETAVEHGAVVLNYTSVTELLKDQDGKLSGVTIRDEEPKQTFSVLGKNIINATGVFADDILNMDNPKHQKLVAPSQGVHLIIDKSFLPGNDAIMIPKTDDGRVLFLVPWHDRVILGTTDTPVKEALLEPKALEEEIEFILKTAGRYLSKVPKRSDVLSVYAGLRPLAAPKAEGKKTKEISRSHKIYVSDSGLLTIIGGKWTTYRKMGEDLVNRAEQERKWQHTNTKTKHLKIHGYKKDTDLSDPLYFYGTDKESIMKLVEETPSMKQIISKKLNIIKAQVVWSVRNEMARNVEDFLARRVRAQLLDARESIKIAPIVAKIMAKELGRDQEWQDEQVKQYEKITSNYILN
ncbi:MAG: glycerol-3-phosphate dehydrogenase [bacterium]|nr:MAG: glycerol-3-phosphate dehydrogenase [bacterium]